MNNPHLRRNTFEIGALMGVKRVGDRGAAESRVKR
jgi:hypothetical protein